MYEKYAIFTDLDGTLFNSMSCISAENRNAVSDFVEKGGLFGVSTGRAPENAEPFLTGLPINGWSVVLNGAAAYHFQERKFFPCGCLSHEDAGKVLTWVQKTMPEINIQICTDRDMYFLTKEPYVDQKFLELHREMKNADLEAVSGEAWLKILLCGKKDSLEQIREFAAEQQLLGSMDWVYSSPEYLEFLPRGTSKGSCVARLQQAPELKKRTVICIGDFYNDLELIRQADVGVAVANGVPELKQAADEIACSNDEHAIAWLIYHLIPRLEKKI